MRCVFKKIELKSSRAVVEIIDHSPHGHGFVAKFQDAGRLVPILELGKSPAEALRRLRSHPLVRKARTEAWERSPQAIIRRARAA